MLLLFLLFAGVFSADMAANFGISNEDIPTEISIYFYKTVPDPHCTEPALNECWDSSDLLTKCHKATNENGGEMLYFTVKFRAIDAMVMNETLITLSEEDRVAAEAQNAILQTYINSEGNCGDADNYCEWNNWFYLKYYKAADSNPEELENECHDVANGADLMNNTLKYVDLYDVQAIPAGGCVNLRNMIVSHSLGISKRTIQMFDGCVKEAFFVFWDFQNNWFWQLINLELNSKLTFVVIIICIIFGSVGIFTLFTLVVAPTMYCCYRCCLFRYSWKIKKDPKEGVKKRKKRKKRLRAGCGASCLACLKNSFHVVCFILAHELNNVILLFLVSQSVTLKDDNTIQTRTTNQILGDLLIFFVVGFVVLDLILICLNGWRYFTSPFKFLISLVVYKENWVYRSTISSLYLTVIVITIVIFFIEIIDEMSSIDFVIDVLIALVLQVFVGLFLLLGLIMAYLEIQNYDGCGSVNFMRKLRRGETLPEIMIPLIDLITSQPNGLLNGVIFVSSLVSTPDDVLRKKGHINFRHLPWKYLMKCSEEDLMLLKTFFFVEKNEELPLDNFSDSLYYDPTFSPYRLSVLCCILPRVRKIKENILEGKYNIELHDMSAASDLESVSDRAKFNSRAGNLLEETTNSKGHSFLESLRFAMKKRAKNLIGNGEEEIVYKVIGKCIANHDYQASRDDEISIINGDIVDVFVKKEQNWWIGKNLRTRRVGLFPKTFTSMIIRRSKQNAFMSI